MSYSNGPQLYSKLIRDSNLVLAFDASYSYPGYGSVIYDLVGRYNGVSHYLAQNYNGSYFTFNKKEWINVNANSYALGIYDHSYTCEAVVSFSSLSGDNMIFGNSNSTACGGWHLGTRSSNYYFGQYACDTSSSGAVANTVKHIAWVCDKGVSSNNCKIWVNGTNISGGGSNLGTYIAHGCIFIGAGYDTTNSLFSGNLYYARIYNKALSSEEIINNYNTDKKRFSSLS